MTLVRHQSDARIQISDNGPGISAELLPYVFDRFRQADSSTRRKFGGLGLGLSIVKQLVELHGGTVEADSAGEGLGSTFTVNLPVRALSMQESVDEHDDGQAIRPTAMTYVRLDGLRVLVVDDEPDARRLVVKVLQHVGAVVTAVKSAAEALDALGEAKPEVLVSDLGMPDQDGFALIHQIRALGYHAKDLPAVALSAFAHKNDQRQALTGWVSDAHPQARRPARPDRCYRQPRRAYRSRRIEHCKRRNSRPVFWHGRQSSNHCDRCIKGLIRTLSFG